MSHPTRLARESQKLRETLVEIAHSRGWGGEARWRATLWRKAIRGSQNQKLRERIREGDAGFDEIRPLLRNVQTVDAIERGRPLVPRAEAIPDRTAGIYFIACEELKTVKIGMSVDLRTRLLAHSTGLANDPLLRGDLSLYHVVFTDPGSAAFGEAATHCLYAATRQSRREIFAFPLDPDPREFRTLADLVSVAAGCFPVDSESE